MDMDASSPISTTIMHDKLANFERRHQPRMINFSISDDELERRQLYFVLPTELLYSVLTHEELSSLTYKATKALKFNNFGKIFPVLSEFCIFPSEGKTTDSMVTEPQPMERYSKQRSWKPALETIVETPCRRP
ncbi:hypothetical protein POTOM_041831 [Populus tomentosa]|uniref:Uncharacterized protein n=1 Tax=Populus tomentosa TaxID=118781 RepID=A0A8X8C9G9_POPTO|nr:hypothetical protein POTOM_041831 [Populus tomentosa]